MTGLSAAARRMVRLAHFEPAQALADGEREAFCRRFAVLFVEEETTRRGGIGEVTRAVTATGETVALKRLRPGAEGASDSAAVEAAFNAEYQAHRALSPLRCVPRLYGRGLVDGQSAIVMEWVGGLTLEEAARQLAVDDAGRLSPLVAVRLARDVFDGLASMGYLGGGLAHRDLSLRNIMVDTSRRSLEDQVEDGSFDIRLVDFGSAVAVDAADSSVTARFGGQRGATADFAPPEMLTEDVVAVERLRRSPAVDVYAAGSVLYALLEGRPPYDLSLAGREARACASAYRIKTEFSFEPATGAHGAAPDLAAVLLREPEVAVAVGRAAAELDAPPLAARLRLALSQVDAALEPVVSGCLEPNQAARPTAAAVRDALAAFADAYAENIARALRGEPLLELPLGPEAQRRAARRRRVRRVARVAIDGAAWALAAATAVVTGLLVEGLPMAFPATAPWFSGPAPGAAVAAVLLIPAAVGLLVRGRRIATNYGLVRGVLGDLLGAMLAGLALSLAAWGAPGVSAALYAALMATAASPLVAFAADRLLALPAQAEPSPSRVKRPVLPWGASTAALLERDIPAAGDAASLPSPAPVLVGTEEPAVPSDAPAPGPSDYELPEEAS